MSEIWQTDVPNNTGRRRRAPTADLRAQLRQEREMADKLAAALDLWVKATEARRTETLPFSATPLSHPDLFNRHLRAAQEANAAMAQALDAYRAMRGQE